jgi:polyisoprenoid-binding protein YceI
VAASLTPRAFAALLALLGSTTATAEVWHADQHSGALRFVATQAGARFAGHFGKFMVRLDFDPAQPARARLDATIATQSADTSDAERDELLHGRDFFWTERFPESVYHAEGLKRDGNGWLATGTLTLRGVTQPVAVRFELRPGPDGQVMKGGAALRRLEYGVGQGDWASTEWISDPVDVDFELKLMQESAAPKP